MSFLILASFLVLTTAILPYPIGWYQGSLNGVLFIQANIRTRTEGDVAVLMNLPALPTMSVHGWTLFDLHNGELRMTHNKGTLHIQVLPEGVDSHPVAPRFTQVIAPLLSNVFPMNAEYRRFSNQIEFKIGPFNVRMLPGYDADFITRNIKEGEKLTKFVD